jgi:ribosomal protein S25
MTNRNIDELAARVEIQISVNQNALRDIEDDRIKREARKSFIVANGRVPGEDW